MTTSAQASAGLLITGGTVVDGTGGASRACDVRVRGGVIVEVAPSLKPDGESIIDASGAYVTPGLIDSHTHYDGEMFWDPSLDPLPLYGITTAIMGNCGLGLAPVRPSTRAAVADIMCFVEDLPFTLMNSHVPWGWETWSQYYAVARGVPTTASLFAYTPHNALRAYVMGDAAWERAATANEVALMGALLDDSLESGSLGLSSNFFDTDRARNLVPSRLADELELAALADVLARYPHSSFQVIARSTADAAKVVHATGPRGVRTLKLSGSMIDHDQWLLDEIREHRWDVWKMGSGGNVPSRPRLGFDTSIGTAAVTAWHELVNGPVERKLTGLADDVWRARARHDWDHPLAEQNSFKDLDELILVESENGTGPTGISLASYAMSRGQHPSDALADWVLANGLGSRYMKLRISGQPDNFNDVVVRSMADERAVMGGTDAGAHLRMFCGAGANAYLFTNHVRDGRVSIEAAVAAMTGRSAKCFNLNDRGVVAVGKRADLAVFALDEIELHDEMRVDDLPDGQWRYSRASAGFRATIAGGVPTVLDGKATGERPAGIGHALAASS